MQNNNNKIEKILAKEIGLARYEHIKNHDWKAGDEYWDKTSLFWKEVRDIWNTFLNDNKILLVKKNMNNQSLFELMFTLANESANHKLPVEKEKIQSILNRYIDVIEK